MIIFILILMVLLSLILTVVSRDMFNNIINPISIYSIWWTINSIISSLGLFGLFKPDVDVYMMVLLSIIAFSVGCIIIVSKRDKTGNLKKIDIKSNDIKGNVNYRNVIVINLAAILFMIPYTLEAIEIFINHGAAILRAVSLSEDGLTGSLLNLVIIQWLVLGIFTATMITATIQLTLSKGKKILFFLALVVILVYTFTFGGRWIIYRFIVMLVLSSLFLKSFKKYDIKILKRRKVTLLLSIVGIVSMLVITSQRSLPGLSIAGNLVTYFTGSFTMLDILTNLESYPDIGGGYLFGFASIGGLIAPLLTTFSVITGIEILRPDEIVLGVTGQDYVIGTNTIYNAFATSLYTFGRDFGILGVIIIPFIFGIVCSLVFIYVKRKQSLRAYQLYIFFLYLIISSTMQWDLIHPWPWFTMFFLWVFTKKEKYKKIS
ncbi:O-antigen polymerase [Robertmurraya beringensis]|uniref:O-antigen polymerase n=1 Tax=Robertmurraya beringensis TaxID=641660 RepID=A0ABV6KQX4_9BACI